MTSRTHALIEAPTWVGPLFDASAAHVAGEFVSERDGVIVYGDEDANWGRTPLTGMLDALRAPYDIRVTWHEESSECLTRVRFAPDGSRQEASLDSADALDSLLALVDRIEQARLDAAPPEVLCSALEQHLALAQAGPIERLAHARPTVAQQRALALLCEHVAATLSEPTGEILSKAAACAGVPAPAGPRRTHSDESLDGQPSL